MKPKDIKVGIVGSSGFGGGELLRLLKGHPSFEVIYATAGADAHKSIDEVHPHLRGLYDISLSPHPSLSDEVSPQLTNLDGLFLGVPHGKSMKLRPSLPDHLKVVDLSGDYRLRSKGEFEKYYGSTHEDPAGLETTVYGLTEVFSEEISSCRYVANPGCFATAVQLGLVPLISEEMIHGKVVCDATTGSSGSGASPKATTHHPFRDGSFYAYKLLGHQHEGEILQTLKELGFRDELCFQVHSGPFVRGIFASLHCSLREGYTLEDVLTAFSKTYKDSSFVRLVNGSPNIHWVRQSNFVDIGFGGKGSNLVVFVAIDNLVKGAAGQAIQNMNLMFGLPDSTGLLHAGGYPS